MKIKLKEPVMDKNWGLEFSEATKEQLQTLRNLLLQASHYGYQPFTPVLWGLLKSSHAFLQCCDGNYAFVEFWTDNQSLILRAAEHIAADFKVELEF